ncbi:hypothetical protein [Zobellia laminariae]|uniref:hypothetical protein n=2 Tax=Zobellia laminariae TaxID=248906 RepID=UPI0026F42223|nr:hypothetical protein [Zobellia laminariae]WKX75825.1 hypothetical protein Q5W13_19850 [Zobellia laminariae]
MDAIIEMTSHPAFVDAMNTMKKTPISKRRQLGKKILSIDHLESKGVKVPKGMRVTTRYFESGRPGIIELLPDGKIRGSRFPRFPIGDKLDPGTVAWGGCACAGAENACGGMGGST